jgi:ribosomal-protein-alanine N-acetyltransferase
MKTNLRKARPADLSALCAIENSWATTPQWSRRQFESELGSERSLLLVAEENNCLLGYACAWKVSPELHILNIAVHPQHVRRGIGCFLLQGLLQEAKVCGCLLAQLELSENNQPAKRLYESQGFHVVGKRPKYYNDSSDALLMDKNL